jgi:ABC-2 type transport system permease protein
LLYFVLGFLLYATIMAGVGSLVKRQEEARNAVQIPMLLMMGGYIAGEIGISAPNSTWMKVLSYIPFFTPTTMLVRIAGGQVAWWEIVITIPLMVVAIALCAWISARIYRSGILMYGQKPGLRQVLKLMRQ